MGKIHSRSPPQRLGKSTSVVHLRSITRALCFAISRDVGVASCPPQFEHDSLGATSAQFRLSRTRNRLRPSQANPVSTFRGPRTTLSSGGQHDQKSERWLQGSLREGEKSGWTLQDKERSRKTSQTGRILQTQQIVWPACTERILSLTCKRTDVVAISKEELMARYAKRHGNR